MVLTGPLTLAIMVTLLEEFSWLAELTGPGHHSLTSGAFYRDALVGSLVLFFGGVLAGLAATVYLLYGLHSGSRG